MSFEVWLVYLAAVFAFMIAPGPSHLLMLSNSLAHGFRPSVATAFGDLAANALQMAAAAFGLAALLMVSQSALSVVKWAGVAYLLWMGARLWRRARAPLEAAAGAASLRGLWLQGFLTSAANPKAVVFFAALFPQFIDPDRPLAVQFCVLAATYVVIDGAFLFAYGAGAGWLAARLRARAGAAAQRLGAVFLMGAALLLGAKTLEERG